MKGNVPVYGQYYINEGQGEVVLLLHGLFGNVKMWSKTISALKTRFQVIVPRLPLYDVPSGQDDVSYQAEVLHEFISWHQLTDVSIVGHGPAAHVALLYAFKYPANVKRIVISGSTGFQNRQYFPVSQHERVDYETVEQSVQNAFYSQTLASRKLVDQVYAAVQHFVAQPAFASWNDHTVQSSILNKIDHPVLLLWGLEDKVTPPEVAMHFQDFLQNSVIHFIERCGHVPMVEQPDIYNWNLKQFMEA